MLSTGFLAIERLKLYHYPASHSARAKWALHEVVGDAFGVGLCKGDVFRGCISRLSKRPAFLAAFADAREFTAEVPPDKALAAKFTGW